MTQSIMLRQLSETFLLLFESQIKIKILPENQLHYLEILMFR